MSDAATTAAPVFHVEPKGGLASRMIQYMVALKFQTLLPGCIISNVVLPEWGIEHPTVASPGPEEVISQQHHIDLQAVVQRVRAGETSRVIYAGLGQRMENLLSPEAYRAVFPPPGATPFECDARHLVCPIGTADAAQEHGLFHPLTPVEFYADIVAETGLEPIFVGRIEADAYTDRLRAGFPQARFVDTGSVTGDFQLIRRAKNIVVGVSTFAWLAAWLSDAERIFMTVSGLFNPRQYHAVDLLPFGDPRYRFCLFPINFAVPLQYHAAAHRRIAPFWLPVSHEVLRRRLREAPRMDPSNDEMLASFDAEFYLGMYQDVARVLGATNTDGARAHYQVFGHREQRLPFRLAPTWYAARYPMAALEVAQGDYSDFAHHYVAVGRARGYRPMPDDTAGHTWWD